MVAPLRVLIVSQYFAPEAFRINDIVADLASVGCSVTVLTGQPNYPDGKIFSGHRFWGFGKQETGQAWSLFRVPLLPRGRGGGLRLVANYLSFVISASLLGPILLRGKKFDVVFVYAVSPILQAIPAIVMKSLGKASLVIWVQDLWPSALKVTGFVKHERLLKAVGSLTAWIYRRADLLLVPSRSFAQEVEARAGNIPVVFHPNPGEQSGSAAQAESHLPMPGRFNVIFAGNMGKAQGLETVMEAARVLAERPDIGFVMVGSGSARDDLMKRAKGLTNVSFPGRFPSEAMPAIYAQASLLLVSLVKDDDLAVVLPSKVPTYLAAGRPIVAALAGEGARVIEESGAGVVVPQQDAVALAEAIRHLSALPAAELGRMGQSGLNYYMANFEPKRLTGQLFALLDGVARGKRGHAEGQKGGSSNA